MGFMKERKEKKIKKKNDYHESTETGNTEKNNYNRLWLSGWLFDDVMLMWGRGRAALCTLLRTVQIFKCDRSMTKHNI
jgi:hypothetical protein